MAKQDGLSVTWSLEYRILEPATGHGLDHQYCSSNSNPSTAGIVVTHFLNLINLKLKKYCKPYVAFDIIFRCFHNSNISRIKD